MSCGYILIGRAMINPANNIYLWLINLEKPVSFFCSFSYLAMPVAHNQYNKLRIQLNKKKGKKKWGIIKLSYK